MHSSINIEYFCFCPFQVVLSTVLHVTAYDFSKIFCQQRSKNFLSSLFMFGLVHVDFGVSQPQLVYSVSLSN